MLLVCGITQCWFNAILTCLSCVFEQWFLLTNPYATSEVILQVYTLVVRRVCFLSGHDNQLYEGFQCQEQLVDIAGVDCQEGRPVGEQYSWLA